MGRYQRKIDWDASLALGVKHIDMERRHLVALTNSLHEVLHRSRFDEDAAAIVVGNVAIHMPVYFDQEEEVLAAVRAPGLAQHRSVHRAAIDVFTRLRNHYDHLPATQNAVEIHGFLVKWLIHHEAREVEAARAAIPKAGLEGLIRPQFSFDDDEAGVVYSPDWLLNPESAPVVVGNDRPASPWWDDGTFDPDLLFDRPADAAGVRRAGRGNHGGFVPPALPRDGRPPLRARLPLPGGPPRRALSRRYSDEAMMRELFVRLGVPD